MKIFLYSLIWPFIGVLVTWWTWRVRTENGRWTFDSAIALPAFLCIPAWPLLIVFYGEELLEDLFRHLPGSKSK